MDDNSSDIKGIKDYILDNKTKILILVIYACILVFVVYTIFEHIFHLTKFVIKYNEAFDYGKFVKGLCSDEYFEFETGRFQVTASQKDIQLTNSSNKYMTFILVVTIIISLFISMLFSYIINNTFYNWSWFVSKLELPQGNIRDEYEDWQTKLKDYIDVYIIKPFTNYFLILYKLVMYLLADKEDGIFIKLVFLIMIVIIYLLVICVLVIMPTYIGLKLSDKNDISPFNTNYEVYVPYIVVCALIILLRFSYNIFKSKSVISDYLEDNVNHLFTSNDTSGYIAFFLLMAIYLTMYYILGNIINIYKKYRINPEYQEESSHTQSVFEEFMNKTFGYNEFNNFEIENVFIKNTSGMVATLAIILMVVVVALFIMRMFNITNNENVLVKNGIIVPLLSLFIIIFTSINSTEFNKIINKYLLQNPSVLYKQYINILNNMLSPILQSEYENYDNTQSGYICRNTGNAILLALYSDIFKDISNINRNGDEVDEETIDIIPEFEYDFACDNINPFTFNGANEYDISFYFDGKDLKKNIFYKYNKCTSINTKVLTQMKDNHMPFLGSKNKENIKLLIDKMMKEIDIAFYNGSTNTLTEDPGLYVRKVILDNRDTFDDIKEELKDYEKALKSRIITSIMNIQGNNTYNDTKKVLITKDESMGKYYQNNKVLDVAPYEVYQHNNNLNELIVLPANKLPTDIESAVDQIIEIYMNNIYHFLYIFVPLWRLEIQQKCNTNDDKCQIIQDKFVEKLIANLKSTFGKINDVLTQPLSPGLNNKMTKFIINNYNNVHTDKVYKKNWLDIIKQQDVALITEDEKTYILTYSNILGEFMKVNDNINELVLAFQKKTYHTPNFIISLKSSKLLCQTVIEQLKKEDSDKFRNAINKHLFANDGNKYILTYVYKGKTKTLDDDLYDILIHMIELSMELIDEMNKKYEILIGTDNSENKLDSIDKNIDVYYETLKTNVGHFKYDMELQKTKSVDAGKQIDPVDTLTIDQSRQITSDTIAADKIIYMLIVNYIISIILTNFIY